MNPTILDTAKGRVEYSLKGQGEVILFVHGGHVNCRETIFEKGLDPTTHCFLMPSRPGYGNTPLNKSNRTPKGGAALIIALLDELDISKVIVIGISAGGLTALEIVSRYPERVERLILMSAITQNWFDKNDSVYIGAKKIFHPGVQGITWLLYRLFSRLAPKTMAKLMFKQVSTYRPIDIQKEEVGELMSMTRKMSSGKGFSNDLDQTIDHNVLSYATCPTLILHSKKDGAVDASHALNAQRRIKGSRLVLFNNRWGHLLWIGEEYQLVLKEINQELSNQQG